jgi:hypothetical protein
VPTLQSPIDKVGDNVTILAWNFPWTIGVEKTRANGLESIMVIEKVAVQFPQHFGDLVRRAELDGNEILPEWQRSMASVYRTP